ncbi:MAG: nucleotidyltransferase family protein [Oscillospiraceae bacterium]|nr:nucleotidyltransferase family protein [Oscillospiraceae bacterium]
MKTSAIICEYNPLHNGHVHHIEETRRHGATHILCILSSNFVQRGDVALLSKFDRAHLAVMAGADLVIELPTPFSCAAAENYASGAVSLIDRLGIADELSFGSSTGNIEDIDHLTEASIAAAQHGSIRERMKQGLSYPAAVCEAVREDCGEAASALMQDPNNLLAIEYRKAMLRRQVSFSAYTIPRKGAMHDSPTPDAQFASASHIRQTVMEGGQDPAQYMPDYAARCLSERISEGKTASLRRLERVALYRMRTISQQELLAVPDMPEQLAGRFYAARNADSLEDLLAQVKTRCYTMSRIRRIVMGALIGIRKEMLPAEPPYARVLAFNERGRELMAAAQKKAAIPISTSLAQLRDTDPACEAVVQTEEHASQVYGLAQGTISSADADFRARIIMEKQP